MIQKNRCLQEKLYGFAELLKEEKKQSDHRKVSA